jgi:hypothetical protein
MGFCTKCGGEVATEDSFCRKCGAPRKARSAPDPIQTEVVGAVERDARLRLKRAHYKISCDPRSRWWDRSNCLHDCASRDRGSHGTAAWRTISRRDRFWLCGSLRRIARLSGLRGSINRTLSKIEDPLTGEPLRMLWWFRWFAAMLGLFLFIGLSDYVNPSGPESATTNTLAKDAPLPWTQVHLTPEQEMEGRRALCHAVREEWPDVEAGTQGKDKFPLILAFNPFRLTVPIARLPMPLFAPLSPNIFETNGTNRRVRNPPISRRLGSQTNRCRKTR